MKTKTVKTNEYWLLFNADKLCSDGETTICNGKVVIYKKDERARLYEHGCFPLLAHQPITNAPLLEGVPVLPERPEFLNEAHSIMRKMGIFDYLIAPVDTDKWRRNLAEYLKTEKKQYSEKDVRKAIEMAREMASYGSYSTLFSEDEIINSLSVSKGQWAFEPEWDESTVVSGGLKPRGSVGGKGLQRHSTKTLKTIPNPDHKNNPLVVGAWVKIV